MQECPFVSVIIPVFNDAERLTLCLAALTQQNYERSHYEIIVVDNGSDKPEAVKAVMEQSENARFASEPTPGSYAARNKGLSIARGEVIAFTDADCIPDRDWLPQGVYHLMRVPNCGQVVGKIEVVFANPHRPTMVELYDRMTAFPQERLLNQLHGGATANVFTWRHVIEKVGSFNAQLKSHGDLEWGGRVHAQGYAQVYAASAWVEHPARSSLQELYVRTQRLAGGSYDLQLEQAQSVWERQVVFLRTLLQHLVPPVFFVLNAFSNADLSGIGQKLKVSLVMVMVRYVSAWETLRLKLGGVSSRV